MNVPVIQGWCPGALKPMLSGDGYVVRIRPRAGRLTAEQLAAIAALSRLHGNGLVDFSARANLQMRGVTERGHPALIEALRQFGLVDETVAQETTRNILVTPFWHDGDGTLALAGELADRLAGGPTLPGKFGFAVDTGPAPALASASADIRLERDADGQMILRADGMDAGCPVDAKQAAAKAVELACWFLDSGGAPHGRGRMARHLADGATLPAQFAPASVPASALAVFLPGAWVQGYLAGFEFGQATAGQLEALASCAPAFRVTPWRTVLLEGTAEPPAIEGLITNAADPFLRVTACTGAPACPQAHLPTRPLARALAPHVPAGGQLHVAGCAKGCAHPAACNYTLTATADGFELALDGRAGDTPVRTGLDPAAMMALPATVFGTA